jgi:hypothetical protein
MSNNDINWVDAEFSLIHIYIIVILGIIVGGWWWILFGILIFFNFKHMLKRLRRLMPEKEKYAIK